MKDKPHDDAMAEVYRKDPAYALQLLNAILEDGEMTFSPCKPATGMTKVGTIFCVERKARYSASISRKTGS